MSRQNDIDIRAGVEGVEESKRKLKELGGSAKDVGKDVDGIGPAAKETTRSLGGLTAGIGHFVSSIKGLVLGAFSISTLINLYQKWREEINKTIDAQNKLTDTTNTFMQAVKEIANQYGDMSKTGMAAAKSNLSQIMMAGPALSVASAKVLNIAAHSTYGTPGQPLTGAAMDITKEVARFSSMKSLEGAEGGQMFKLLQQFGVKDLSTAQQRLGQISAAEKSAVGFNFGAFTMGLAQLAPRSIALGATPEDVLATYVASIGITGTEQEASELDKQINYLIADPKVIKEVAKRTGIAESAFMELPFMTKKMAIGEWMMSMASTGKGQKKMGEYLQPRELQRAMSLFSPGGIATIESGRKLMAGSDASSYLKQISAWEGTAQSQIEKANQATTLMAAGATEEMTVGKSIMDNAETIRLWNQAKGKGRMFQDDRLEREWIAFQLMQTMWKDVEKKVGGEITPVFGSMAGQGNISTEIAYYKANTARGAKAAQLFDIMYKNKPSRIGDLTPMEIGEYATGFNQVMDNSVTWNMYINPQGEPAAQAKPLMSPE